MSDKTDRADLFEPPIKQGTGPIYVPDDAKPIEIGDRVQVNFSAECEVINSTDSPAAKSAILRGHAADINAQGKSGTIIEFKLGDENLSLQHHYLVQLDDPFEFNNHHFSSTTAAATELIPLNGGSQ